MRLHAPHREKGHGSISKPHERKRKVQTDAEGKRGEFGGRFEPKKTSEGTCEERAAKKGIRGSPFKRSSEGQSKITKRKKTTKTEEEKRGDVCYKRGCTADG